METEQSPKQREDSVASLRDSRFCFIKALNFLRVNFVCKNEMDLQHISLAQRVINVMLVSMKMAEKKLYRGCKKRWLKYTTELSSWEKIILQERNGVVMFAQVVKRAGLAAFVSFDPFYGSSWGTTFFTCNNGLTSNYLLSHPLCVAPSGKATKTYSALQWAPTFATQPCYVCSFWKEKRNLQQFIYVHTLRI